MDAYEGMTRRMPCGDNKSDNGDPNSIESICSGVIYSLLSYSVQGIRVNEEQEHIQRKRRTFIGCRRFKRVLRLELGTMKSRVEMFDGYTFGRESHRDAERLDLRVSLASKAALGIVYDVR